MTLYHLSYFLASSRSVSPLPPHQAKHMQSARIRLDQQQQYKAAAVEQLAKNYALKLDGASVIHAIHPVDILA